jgi:hypothetical protein
MRVFPCLDRLRKTAETLKTGFVCLFLATWGKCATSGKKAHGLFPYRQEKMASRLAGLSVVAVD